MTDIIWETPAGSTGAGRPRSALYDALADALRARPGEWARMPQAFKKPTHAHSRAASINSGRIVASPRGEFQALSRKVDGQSVVYVRYIAASAA